MYKHSFLTILMNVPCNLYSLLSRPTDQHTGITPIRLPRLYMQPPNKQLPRVIIINVLQIVFYHSQWSREHFNLLILLSCNFNNFVTWAKYKFKTPWRWCRYIETFRSAYDIWNIINIYVEHLLVWIIKFNSLWCIYLHIAYMRFCVNKTVL